MEKIRIPQALRDEIIVKQIFEEKKSSLIIPETAQEWKQYHGEVYGEVVSVGPEYPYKLKVGDKIIYQRHEGNKLPWGEIKYLRLKSKWVLARVK
jgi:co-chaperonin GroES (HSP10)